MVSFNATLFVQILNFFVLLFLLDRLFFRKLIKVMSERRQFLTSAEKQVSNQLAELRRLQDEHTMQIEAARQEAQTAIHGRLAEAESEKNTILATVRQEVETQLTSLRGELTEQRAQAEAQLRSEVTTLAEQIADKAVQVSRQPVLR